MSAWGSVPSRSHCLESAPRPTPYVVRPKGHAGAPPWPLGMRKLRAAVRFLMGVS